MKTKIQNSIIGGLVGAAVMTLVMFIAPMMGMPKMNPAAMLSGMMGIPIAIGWMMHFMVGVIFALGYAFLLSDLLKSVSNRLVNGIVFGLIVFVFAQIMMMIMRLLFGGMSPEGNMALMMIGSIMGHIVYGVVTVLFVKVKS